MSLKENVYHHSPVFLQHLLTSLYGTYLRLERYGPAYRKRMTELIGKEGRFVDYQAEQLDRLNVFLSFCAEHSPYYKRLFAEHHVQLPFISLEQLEQIPPLEKETLRQHHQEVRTDVHAPILSCTGGTTGTSLHVHYTKDDMQRRIAHLDYFKMTHGIRHGMRRASFTGKPLVKPGQKQEVFWRLNKPIQQILFSTTQIRCGTIPCYIKKLNAFQPESMDGIASGMIEIARYAKTHGTACTFRPRAIFPTSEMILPADRALLEEVFHAPVYDQYASSEGAPIVAECRYGNKHLHYEMGIIERDPGTGEILVTSFDTHGTPLVRYRVGDRMTFSDATCSCGHAGPIIASIDGRGRAFVYRDDGRKLFECDLTRVIASFPNSIKQVQYVQDRPNEVLLLYVPDFDRFTADDEGKLRSLLQQTFGPRTVLHLHAVPEIPRETSGKTLLVKQRIPETAAQHDIIS